MGDVFGEMLDNEPDLLGYVGRVECHPFRQRPLGGPVINTLLLNDLLPQVKGGLVGQVPPQNVQDEPLVDCLSHFVLMKRDRQVVVSGLA